MPSSPHALRLLMPCVSQARITGLYPNATGALERQSATTQRTRCNRYGAGELVQVALWLVGAIAPTNQSLTRPPSARSSIVGPPARRPWARPLADLGPARSPTLGPPACLPIANPYPDAEIRSLTARPHTGINPTDPQAPACRAIRRQQSARQVRQQSTRRRGEPRECATDRTSESDLQPAAICRT